MSRVTRIFGDIKGRPLPRTFGTGSIGNLDIRRKRRGKKQPLGFAPPEKKK